MRQTLSINHELCADDQRGRSEMQSIEADTDWEVDSPIYPQAIVGQLLDVPSDAIAELRFAAEVAVYFKARRYKFETLENDGSFVLRRTW